MKVLVCGSSGLVGNDLCLLLEKEEIDYVGIHNTRPRHKSHRVNILDKVELSWFIELQKPTVCVNCIADRNVDACETNWEQTKKINVDIPSILATVCAEKKIYFIQISTDYIFDGRHSPYSPDSQANPLQIYGITKFLAECRVKTASPNACILRVPVLYTNTFCQLTDTAVTVLAKKVMNQIETVKEDNYSVRRPVFIPDFCQFILDCIRYKRPRIFHFFNPDDKTTKYQMCKMIGEFLQKSTDHILPINDPPSNDASRPYDTKFIDMQYNRKNFPNTPLRGGVALCLEKYWHPPLFSSHSAGQVLVLIDLDGTLVDTDKLHYECYKQVLSRYTINITWDEYSQFKVLDDSLRSIIQNESLFQEVKREKRNMIHSTNSIQMIPGAENLLKSLNDSNTEFVVVTNTGKETVEHFKNICPPLQCVKNWITREDYSEPKPNPECYKLALEKFHTNQTYIVGIENTLSGYEALEHITSRVYILTDTKNPDYTTLKKKDCYLIQDLTCLNTRVA